MRLAGSAIAEYSFQIAQHKVGVAQHAPCPADRLLTSRLGVAAAKLIEQKKYGYMVAVQDDKIVPVPCPRSRADSRPSRRTARSCARCVRSACP